MRCKIAINEELMIEIKRGNPPKLRITNVAKANQVVVGSVYIYPDEIRDLINGLVDATGALAEMYTRIIRLSSDDEVIVCDATDEYLLINDMVAGWHAVCNVREFGAVSIADCELSHDGQKIEQRFAIDTQMIPVYGEGSVMQYIGSQILKGRG